MSITWLPGAIQGVGSGVLYVWGVLRLRQARRLRREAADIHAADRMSDLLVGHLHDTPANRAAIAKRGLSPTLMRPGCSPHIDVRCPGCGVLTMIGPRDLDSIVKDASILRCGLCAARLAASDD